MNRYYWTRWLAAGSVVVLLTSGCSLGLKHQAQPIDPPPTSAETMAAQPQQKLVSPVSATLYFKDANGLVSPISMGLPAKVEVAKLALQYMVEDGPGQKLLPKGFVGLLPKGTEVKGIDLKNKLATVDFSKAFNEYNVQDERKIMEAITWTLTGFPTIEQVRIRVEGKDLKEMPMAGTPIDGSLSRAMGINIEKPDNVEYGRATPVTLYFLAQGPEQYKYYVPVTRLVKRTDDIAQAAVQELIKGPDQKTGLTPVFAPATEVLQVNKTNDLVTVNFSDKVLGMDKKAPAEALQAVVLSLTENTGVPKVQIEVNGDAKIASTDNQNYSKPVMKPVHLNEFKM